MMDLRTGGYVIVWRLLLGEARTACTAAYHLMFQDIQRISYHVLQDTACILLVLPVVYILSCFQINSVFFDMSFSKSRLLVFSRGTCCYLLILLVSVFLSPSKFFRQFVTLPDLHCRFKV
jgi:hypothetical protein